MAICKGCEAKDQEIQFLRSLVTESMNKPKQIVAPSELQDAYWTDYDGIHHKIEVPNFDEDSP